MITELSILEIKQAIEAGKKVAVMPLKSSPEYRFPKGDLRRWLYLEAGEVHYTFFPFGPQSDGKAKVLRTCNRYGGGESKEKYNCYIES